MNNTQFLAVAGIGALMAASGAIAGEAILTLENGNGGGGAFNTTLFTLANTSEAGVNLTQATFTIGDTQYLFDQLYLSDERFLGGDGSQTATLLVGERSDNNVGPDLFTYGFANFGPGVTFGGQWDIDNDNGDFNADTRTVLFSNGAAPNATLTLTFSDGSSVLYTFPDLPAQDRYTLTIPGSGGAGPAAAGIILAVARRRRLAD